MKVKIFKNALIALLLAGGFSSCGNKLENDPNKLIQGKWELIGLGTYLTQYEIEKLDPKGYYIEFLSDGNVRNYDPDNEEFHYVTYIVDESIIIYNHEKTFDEGRNEYKYEIIKNQLKMTHYKGHTTELYQGHILIYQQKE